ncbi:MAG: alpha-glucan phosphorylase [Anaerolineae bacterium UTCFX2]|jgi:starch phosphorylase|nr:alpha-glucan family phosphorylase [Anaerolineales bacterium]OQY90947.1 MAG: alpha-glucan phosphorylase [Anaerolineae bacterium UTCFX2]
MHFRTQTPNSFSLPRRIHGLAGLAYNLWWTWNPDAQRLFSRIDAELWEQTYHNPIKFLRQVSRARLNAATNNRYYLEFYDHMLRLYEQYMQPEQTWFSSAYPDLNDRLIAYFSMEFGLHETLPIYAGGLGVLSGDHAKEASDLGLPFIAIGFFYTEGYFTQYISEDGWQEAQYNVQKFEDLPVLPVLEEDGTPLTVSVELPDRAVQVRLWEVRVGRAPLYLLDANLEQNSFHDRALTARLYSSDLDLRISQEILLGIGGVRALRKMGYAPAVWHMNEGHSAFMVLERIRELVTDGMTYEEAAQNVHDASVFTTHTPVPAGNDEFPLWLVEKYFSHFWPQLGLDRDQFINLARHEVSWGDLFSMPALALTHSAGRNAVSELHGQVARRMWAYLWPDRPEDETTITHITNGVHVGTWLARRLRHLFDRYLGAEWLERADDPDVWELVNNIPDAQIWEVRLHLKRKLAAYVRERARQRWRSGSWHPIQVVASGVLLNPYALTIGFARRFAPYKRANLLFTDVDRLLKIINNAERPVQIIFAGKSHPDHEGGKMIIQEVYRTVKRSESGGRLVFLEDYDMNLARYLVQGVDVWLNTPRRPNEASGTSGQKAGMNGVLNFSVLDGWWREGYNGRNGWAIGEDLDYADAEAQDAADAKSLYDLLENEIVPLFYQTRSSDGLPGEWILRMKESIRTIGPQFSMRRMVKEYLERLYLPEMKGECPEELGMTPK